MAGDSKTEKATPKKRKDERKKGNTFSSKDIISVAAILSTFFALSKLFPFMLTELEGSLYKYINYTAAFNTISITFAMEILHDVTFTFIMVAFPVMLVSIAVSVVVTGAQTRFLFASEGLKPKFNRLSPLQGFKRMFSLKSFIEVMKGTVKIIIIGYVLYNFFIGEIEFFSKTLSMDIAQSAELILQAIMSLMYNICMIFVFIALLDYIYQWWDYEKQLKMSKQEVKEEYKQTEGDPQVKGQIKERQRKIAMSRMMQMVPTADVVIRNPTHYAVALRYDNKRDNAPKVIAKGQDDTALRIVRKAYENDVYVLENKELTRAVYATTDINQEISLEHYNAVAEVLALVYKIKEKQI